jgi:hypothetical protein
MEVQLVVDKIDLLQQLVIWGVTAGVALAVVVGFMRLGFKYAPYIALAAFLVYMLS